MNIELEKGWSVGLVVDDDGHLNVYVDHDDGSEIVEIDTGQGDGDGEQYATRFTTEATERANAVRFLALEADFYAVTGDDQELAYLRTSQGYRIVTPDEPEYAGRAVQQRLVLSENETCSFCGGSGATVEYTLEWPPQNPRTFDYGRLRVVKAYGAAHEPCLGAVREHGWPLPEDVLNDLRNLLTDG